MSIAEQVLLLKTDFYQVRQAGYFEGYETGSEEGYGSGRSNGYTEGYSDGYAKGKEDGSDTEAAYHQGVTDGKQAEYDRIWDIIQRNGERTSYQEAFRGYIFNAQLFYPKYDIRAVGDFGNSFGSWSGSQHKFGELDLAARLEECGVVLDTSEVTSFNRAFYYSYAMNRLPVIDMSKATNTNRAFSPSPYLVTIDKVIVSETTPFTECFHGDSALVNIAFEGTIGQNGLSFHQSHELSKASIISVINALSATTSGLSVTFSKKAVNKAFETSEDANDGSTSDEWTALIATKPNWTISLYG